MKRIASAFVSVLSISAWPLRAQEEKELYALPSDSLMVRMVDRFWKTTRLDCSYKMVSEVNFDPETAESICEGGIQNLLKSGELESGLEKAMGEDVKPAERDSLCVRYLLTTKGITPAAAPSKKLLGRMKRILEYRDELVDRLMD